MTNYTYSPLSTFFYSIANKKSRDKLNVELHALYNYTYLPKEDKRCIKYTLEVAENGKYPSAEYYQMQGYSEADRVTTVQELLHLGKSVRDFFKRNYIETKLLEAINDTNTTSELTERLKVLVEQDAEDLDIDLDEYQTQLQEEDTVTDNENAYLLGIDDIDEITGGIQPGMLAILSAFTSQGKSTLAVSSAYRNIKQGKKMLFFALEITPELVLLAFFVRWLYEEKGISISVREITAKQIPEDLKIKYKELKKEFNEYIQDKLVIVDEAALNKTLIQDYKMLQMLYKAVERKLRGLDVVIYDHLNQIDLMFKDMGNVFVKTITSAGKTYKSTNDIPLITIGCAQANREGNKRAAKREGKYDLQALSDLNELERSATYVIFLFTDDNMKLLQETKITMPKHRLGSVLVEPVTVNFNPANNVIGEMVSTPKFNDTYDFLSGDGVQTAQSSSVADAFDDI